MDETKLTEQQLRGETAAQILENPLFKEAFEALEETLVDAWKSTAAHEDEQRDNAYKMLRLSREFKQFFVTHIANGKAAANKLLEIKDQSKIMRFISNG